MHAKMMQSNTQSFNYLSSHIQQQLALSAPSWQQAAAKRTSQYSISSNETRVQKITKKNNERICRPKIEYRIMADVKEDLVRNWRL